MLTTFRIIREPKNNFVTVDVYKSPGLRNSLARFIARLLRI